VGIASFELRPEQVLLVSARDAYLARLVLSKQPVPPRLLANFREIAFGRSRSRVRVFMKQVPFVSRASGLISPWLLTESASMQVSEKAMLEAAEAMLQDSGMLELEQRVLQFLVSNAAAIKLESILDDAQRLLHTVSTEGQVCHAGLRPAAGLAISAVTA